MNNRASCRVAAAISCRATVEHDSHLVVGNHVSQATNDQREVEPALNELAKVAEQLGTPQVMVADAGYHSKENVERCERHGIDPYIAGSREHHNQPLAQRMQAPPACPADADAVTAMQYRLRTAEGKAIYSKRKSTVETGIPAFSSARAAGSAGRMESGVHGVDLKRLYVLAG